MPEDRTWDGASAPPASSGGDPAKDAAPGGSGVWTLPPPSPPLSQYVVSGDTVHDNVTGLDWLRTTLVSQAWTVVIDRCESMVAAGHDDWRLATRLELLSILDFAGVDTTLRRELFPAAPTKGLGTFFWTSSRVGASRDMRWAVDVYGGRPGRFDKGLLGRPACVRGPFFLGAAPFDANAPPAPSPFAVDQDTITDRRLGLVWTKTGKPDAHWVSLLEAKDYCEHLTIPGVGAGFRLPTIRELLTLVDESRHETDEVSYAEFGMPNGTRYWSSTPWPGADGENFAYEASYGTVIGTAWDTGNSMPSVRCVR